MLEVPLQRAVVAGDQLTVDFVINSSTGNSGAIVPAGSGATSQRFQILNTSLVG